MKLLSVLLTVLMIFSSVSVGASAAKASYQTVQNLKDLQAYSPYGTVTRLSTEERMSILFDSLDNLLAPMTSLNMGYLVNVNLLITKIQLYVNLTSVNEICKTLDSAASLLTSTIGSIAKGIVNLGIVEEVNLKTWNNTYSGMSRENTDQLRIVQGILDTLDDNGAVIDTVFTNGLELGMIKNFITGLDLSGINKLIVDLHKTRHHCIQTIAVVLKARRPSRPENCSRQCRVRPYDNRTEFCKRLVHKAHELDLIQSRRRRQ